MVVTTNQILLAGPLSLDATLSNYFISGSTIVVETIEQYLTRVVKSIRKFGTDIIIIEQPGVYVMSEFLTSTGFTHKNYSFSNGLEDVNFVESLTGVDIVSMLSALPLYEKLKASDVSYGTGTVKSTFDTMLNPTTGDVEFNCYYNDIFKSGVVIEIYDSVGNLYRTITTSGSTLTASLPFDIYSAKINPPSGYLTNTILHNGLDITGDVIKNTVTNIDVNIDSGVTTINVTLVAAAVPVLNYIEINDGASVSSTSKLDVKIYSSEVVEYYMISTDPNFVNADWLTYTTPTVTFIQEYISDMTITIYVKLKNQLGVSDVASSSITLISGILRSDSSTSYRSIIDAYNAIYIDYSGVLTTNVTIYCSGKTINTRLTDKFLLNIVDFNLGSEYVLTIDGSNNLTIDCASLGGIKVLHSENIIFKNINFINVGSKLQIAAPEELSAINIQGNAAYPCDNVVILDNIITCIETSGSTTKYGDYGIICSNCPNVTISGNILSGSRAALIKMSFIDNSNIVGNIFSGHQVDGVIGHPAQIISSNCIKMNITDNEFSGNTFDSALIINATQITVKRNKFYNFDGEYMKIANSLPGEYLDISGNLMFNNLLSPQFYWEKANIYLSNTFKLVRFVSNTCHLIGNTHSTMQEFLFTFYLTTIDEMIFSNNVIIFDYLTYSLSRPNSSGGALINAYKINSFESDNNIYFDTTGTVDTLNNYIMNTDPSSPVLIRFKYDLASYRALGYEINSKVIPLTSDVFVSRILRNYNLNLLGSTTLTRVSGDTEFIDINYNSGSTNSGSYGYNYSTIDESDMSTDWYSIDLLNSTTYSSDQQTIIYSTEKILLESLNINRKSIFNWIVRNKDYPSLVKIILGKSGIIKLESNLNIGGTYLSDANYDIEVNKI